MKISLYVSRDLNSLHGSYLRVSPSYACGAGPAPRLQIFLIKWYLPGRRFGPLDFGRGDQLLLLGEIVIMSGTVSPVPGKAWNWLHQWTATLTVKTKTTLLCICTLMVLATRRWYRHQNCATPNNEEMRSTGAVNESSLRGVRWYQTVLEGSSSMGYLQYS